RKFHERLGGNPFPLQGVESLGGKPDLLPLLRRFLPGPLRPGGELVRVQRDTFRLRDPVTPEQEGDVMAGEAIALLDPRDAFLLQVGKAEPDGSANGSVVL